MPTFSAWHGLDAHACISCPLMVLYALIALCVLAILLTLAWLLLVCAPLALAGVTWGGCQ